MDTQRRRGGNRVDELLSNSVMTKIDIKPPPEIGLKPGDRKDGESGI